MLSYWLWLGLYVFLPMLLLLAFRGKLLLKYRKTILLCGLGSLAVAFLWDHFAIRDGLWHFPSQEILGIWLAGLPLEEWIFISFVGMEISMLALVFAGGKNA